MGSRSARRFGVGGRPKVGRDFVAASPRASKVQGAKVPAPKLPTSKLPTPRIAAPGIGRSALVASMLFGVVSSPAGADGLLPDIAGPLVANPNPTSFNAGPFGNVFITGAVSGLALGQSNVIPGDTGALADFTNGQVFVQKTDGPIQFFVQAGLYALPSLGTSYVDSVTTKTELWGPVPEAFVRLAPNENWAIVAGKFQSLAGYESSLTFQNMNIQRGLLWNQSDSVSRGVQANYTVGALSLALSWDDGFYSNRLTWWSGSATWKVDSANKLAFVGSANTRPTIIDTSATPLLQNNSEIYNVVYTHAAGPWILSSYLQYTDVPRLPLIGALHDAATYGAALLASYAFDAATRIGGLSLAGFSLPFRAEYITSTGSVADGAPNLLYGPGSAAWSVTVTPTYQQKLFFTRAEFSYVKAARTTAGYAFGPAGNDTTQARVLLETGFLF